MKVPPLGVCGVVLALAAAAPAQWDPANGDWLKADPSDVRVMTWNVRDRICSSNAKVEARNGWTAVARTIAALRPDVLIIQEAGDNQGNGTGSGVDSVSTLTNVCELLMHGGPDPYKGGTVTSYVQAYAPGYDLPYIFVSGATDGFNRNIILSRFPFADLNGDTRATQNDIPLLFPDAYAPGGNGGIRGFAFAELDLPGEIYAGDLVVGNAHLKSGGSAGDLADRLEAAQNVAYYIDYLFNGAGTGVPDPNDAVRDTPAATMILDERTPVVIGGDWNEDEQTNGRRGPAAWLSEAQSSGGTDGTDRDRSNSTFDDARDVFTSARGTFSNSKLDYLCWQDSIATMRTSFVFNSATIPGAAMPPEIVGYPGGGALVTSFASDHRPVVVDLILPLQTGGSAPGDFDLLSPADGAAAVALTALLDWADAAGADTYTVKISEQPDLSSPLAEEAGLTNSEWTVPQGLLAGCRTYYWGVEALNASGSAASTPASFSFETRRPADFDGDGVLSVQDFTAFRLAYLTGDLAADFNGNGVLDVGDFTAFRAAYLAGC